MSRKFWTPPQLSTMSGIKQDNILGFIKSGELRAINTAANANGKRPRWRIAESDWLEFLERRANKPPAPVQPVRRRRKSTTRQWV